MPTPQPLLFQHDDGRNIAAFPGSSKIAGDPGWHRVGPIEIECLAYGRLPIASESDRATLRSFHFRQRDALLNLHALVEGASSLMDHGEAPERLLQLALQGIGELAEEFAQGLVTTGHSA